MKRARPLTAAECEMLVEALENCTKRLENCARAGGNDAEVIELLLAPFNAALKAVQS